MDVAASSAVRNFLFNDTPTTEIYTLSLHDALPILRLPLADILGAAEVEVPTGAPAIEVFIGRGDEETPVIVTVRSEEYTSELQSRQYLVCRLLLEKKTSVLRSHVALYPVYVLNFAH